MYDSIFFIDVFSRLIKALFVFHPGKSIIDGDELLGKIVNLVLSLETK